MDKRRDFDLPPVRDTKYNRISYDYMSKGTLANLHWHCGITFYDKLGGLDGNPKIIKAGCDFQHYYDDGMQYSLGDIERECYKTIGSLHEAVPDLLVCCSYNGKYYKKSDGEINEHGNFISFEGLKAQEKYNNEKTKVH